MRSLKRSSNFLLVLILLLAPARVHAADTDTDGMEDAWETTNFGNLSRDGTLDYDSDGITDLEEFTNTLDPGIDDAFDDSDGDRYPNVFEIKRSSDPNSAGSTPTANYTVNVAGGADYTNISGAVGAASTANGNFQVITVAAGSYTGGNNCALYIASNKPRLLIIGTAGAKTTIVDCGNTTPGWYITQGAVIASLTIRGTTSTALSVQATGQQVRLVDLFLKANNGGPYAGAIWVSAASKVFIVGCTILDNISSGSTKQIDLAAGVNYLTNTEVWSSLTGTALTVGGSASLVSSHSQVIGLTLSGSGNISGSTNPKVQASGRVAYDSPLIGAGVTANQSNFDFELDARGGTLDIGVDEWLDTDSDNLADGWEIGATGALTALTGLSQDADSDGLTNSQEFALDTIPNDADTDDDGLSDGDEVNTYGTNPLAVDTDADGMPDGWEAAHSLSALTLDQFEDPDGDRYPNYFEYLSSTDPQSASSVPTPDYLVDAALGGSSGGDNIYTTIAEALSAAGSGGKTIRIAAGVYGGGGNCGLSITTSTLLILGASGAASTIIDCAGTSSGWYLYKDGVIGSLTFKRALGSALYLTSSQEVRLVDLVVRDNSASYTAAAVHGASSGKVVIVGSTFFNNTSAFTSNVLYFQAGNITLVNTVAYNATAGDELVLSTATLTAENSLVKGETLTGSGNLAGSTDPLLRADGRLRSTSPLVGAAVNTLASKYDMDLELRPSSGRDIGADEWVDTDVDQLADAWEMVQAGDLTTLTGLTQDADSDGLTNDAEIDAGTPALTADADGDGANDGSEVNTHGTNPLDADTDDDLQPDGWEVTYGLNPLVADGLDDEDGDRFPNLFEYLKSTDPASAAAIPTPDLIVDPALGGSSSSDNIHSTIGGAIGALSGTAKIISITAGTYSGVSNCNLSINVPSMLLLIVGESGASNTIVDCEYRFAGWSINSAAVVESLTVRRTSGHALLVGTYQEVRLVDLIVRDNRSVSYAPGIHNWGSGKLWIVGSTLLNNSTSYASNQIYLAWGQTTIVNTVAWSSGSGDSLVVGGAATLTAQYSLIKGETLAGTGNLAGSVDPLLVSDGHLKPSSPLRDVGATISMSKLDADLDLRPSSDPDIGADQWYDSDFDGLPDSWELSVAGSLTVLSGADFDSDGLTDVDEYIYGCDPSVADTDGDLVSDSLEILYGTNPLVPDFDDLIVDANGDGVLDSLGIQLGYLLTDGDDDGDTVSNVNELLLGTDPLRADSDGDGIDDATDPFPLDPLLTTLSPVGGDSTAPTITLTFPQNAIAL